MKVLTFDIETTHREKANGSTTALPYFGNSLVSIGYKWLGEPHVHYHCYYHSVRQPHDFAFELFQEALDTADVVVGQNIKFDLSWIRDCGFVYEGHIYDTMVAEYILARARRWPLGLTSLAEKYSDVPKEKDLIEPYFKEGKTFYDIPWDIIETYGKADVLATEQVAVKQLEAFGTTFEELFNEEPNTLAHLASVS
jgi:DNA polymerase I-like protein with 3'-5' exonuclease and polymerase domains